MANRRHVTLSIVLSGEEPPSEFRVFAAGSNETTKGTFVFDEASAKSVMAEYTAHGIDLALDYDRALVGGLSLDPAQSGKAAGWFNLEVRSGELWAVNVRWTEPAAEALRRKEWRYMSPAFTADEKGRVTSLLNVAITNLPATRRLDPLMAASITALGANGMNPELVKKALDALAAGDAEGALAILKELIASAAGGGEAPAEPVSEEELADPTTAPVEEEEEKATAIAASISWLHRETGKTTLAASIDEVKTWKASHLKLEAETQKLAKERAAIELGKRKENAVTLTKLGAETPHTTGLAKGKLCKRLLDEPLDEQNERVAALLSAKGGRLPTPPTPPANGGASPDGSKDFETLHGTVTLSASELSTCAEVKADPQVYAANKAFLAHKRK